MQASQLSISKVSESLYASLFQLCFQAGGVLGVIAFVAWMVVAFQSKTAALENLPLAGTVFISQNSCNNRVIVELPSPTSGTPNPVPNLRLPNCPSKSTLVIVPANGPSSQAALQQPNGTAVTSSANGNPIVLTKNLVLQCTIVGTTWTCLSLADATT